MKTHAPLIIILLAALLLSACSPEELAALGEVEIQPEVELQAGGARQSGGDDQGGANRQGEGNVTNQANQTADGGGVISSSGEQSAASQGNDQAGLMPSSSSESAPSEGEQAKAVSWLTYVDEPFKFSIQYPDIYVILPEVDLLSENVSPGLVHQVRFQDRQLAASDTAALQPAQFTVEVFTLSGQTSLEALVQSNLPFPNLTIEPYTYGKLTGLRASTNRALAPNEFYFFAGNGMVYKLTPLGHYSTEMLQSFTILP